MMSVKPFTREVLRTISPRNEANRESIHILSEGTPVNTIIESMESNGPSPIRIYWETVGKNAVPLAMRSSDATQSLVKNLRAHIHERQADPNAFQIGGAPFNSASAYEKRFGISRYTLLANMAKGQSGPHYVDAVMIPYVPSALWESLQSVQHNRRVRSSRGTNVEERLRSAATANLEHDKLHQDAAAHSMHPMNAAVVCAVNYEIGDMFCRKFNFSCFPKVYSNTHVLQECSMRNLPCSNHVKHPNQLLIVDHCGETLRTFLDRVVKPEPDADKREALFKTLLAHMCFWLAVCQRNAGFVFNNLGIDTIGVVGTADEALYAVWGGKKIKIPSSRIQLKFRSLESASASMFGMRMVSSAGVSVNPVKPDDLVFGKDLAMFADSLRYWWIEHGLFDSISRELKKTLQEWTDCHVDADHDSSETRLADMDQAVNPGKLDHRFEKCANAIPKNQLKFITQNFGEYEDWSENGDICVWSIADL